MEKNIIEILSDPGITLEQKFSEYCGFYREYITTPFNDSLEPVVSDAVQEFYPEFHIIRTAFNLTGGKFNYEVSFERFRKIYEYFSGRYCLGGREIETTVKTFRYDFTRNLERGFKDLLGNPFISNGIDARVTLSGLSRLYIESLPYGHYYSSFDKEAEFPLPPDKDWESMILDISLFSSGRFKITPYLTNYIIHDNEG